MVRDSTQGNRRHAREATHEGWGGCQAGGGRVWWCGGRCFRASTQFTCAWLRGSTVFVRDHRHPSHPITHPPRNGSDAFSASPSACAPVTLAAAVRKWMADSVQAVARYGQRRARETDTAGGGGGESRGNRSRRCAVGWPLLQSRVELGSAMLTPYQACTRAAAAHPVQPPRPTHGQQQRPAHRM
jgi:hypothetical protein